MLYWNTISEPLKAALLKLMQTVALKDFRLVGGTALSLQLGHRMSVDIDLFTDADYGSIDFEAIEVFLKDSFTYVYGDFGGNPGMGKSYIVGQSREDVVNLDIYYTTDPFLGNFEEKEKIRIATIEEIVTMKIDVVQRGGRKKDFWDIHELLAYYNISQMVTLHRERFEWTHDPERIYTNIIDFEKVEDDFEPVCLKGKQWQFIKEDIKEKVAAETK